MTKSELFKRMWIPIKRRIPEPDITKWVLVWNYKWEQPFAMDSLTAHCGAKAILAREPVSEDRLFSDWMEIKHD